MVHKLLLAPIAPSSTCTISFCATMLRFQSRLAKEPGVSASITFFDTTKHAEKAFEEGEYDALVLLDARLGVPDDFLIRPPLHPCEISPYPLAQIDWERVSRRLGDEECYESPQFAGNVYNFDPAQAIPTQGSRFAKVPREAVRECAVVKLQKGARLDEVTDMYVDLANPSINNGHVAYTGCVGLRKHLRN